MVGGYTDLGHTWAMRAADGRPLLFAERYCLTCWMRYADWCRGRLQIVCPGHPTPSVRSSASALTRAQLGWLAAVTGNADAAIRARRRDRALLFWIAVAVIGLVYGARVAWTAWP